MAKHILLDSYPLSLLTKPTAGTEVHAIFEWSRLVLSSGDRIYVPEVIDYELRRELIRSKKIKSIAELDVLKSRFRYLPITTDAMLRAAELWAESRNLGTPTGNPAKLDIDVILSAQALTLPVLAGSVVVATSNVSHISRFIHAETWSDITPGDQ